MSTAQVAFWAAPIDRQSPLAQPRLALLHHVMNTTPRITDSSQSIAVFYMSPETGKFHDREPGLIVQRIEETAPAFFDEFPRRDTTPMTAEAKKAAVGRAAKAYYRLGRAGYAKPALRANSHIGAI